MNTHNLNQEINNDFILNQLRIHIAEMERNSKIFDRLNKKFIAYQQQ